ncbi:50S ribosomal protein L25/general stress protein Ctc [Pseudactinotalea suaedae]|jgi:large subunit ribosomal protein L25|uniref:50S ribosomal protein L25/general stress protein Ctc n=1 Tax=Pseudactinotalea suaedae TaxID=1524924 RepID=UPI0012E2E2F1|nr:50S ribosomal protein L25/general stress protein Ctc [Pseudactinotalea suaedae]
MADTKKLAATLRTEFGKGAARRTRRAGLIPVVLYGHGADPIHLSVPSHDTFLALKGNANALLTLEFDGRTELALTKDVQRDAVKRTIEHLDLVLIRRGEKVVVDIPVHVEGESAPGTIHTVESQTLSVRADALTIPEGLNASIEGLVEGDSVRASDVVLPEGVELETDPETAVVVISVPRASAEDLEADETAAEAGAAAGEAGEAATDDDAEADSSAS